jgi:TRAP-type C4-dicarboxylate transport system permease small subunit
VTLKESAQRFRDIVYKLSRAINSIGVLFLMAMMLLMVVDVFLRRVFQKPLTGSFEV